LTEKEDSFEYSKRRKLETKLRVVEKRDRMLEKDRTSDLAVLEEVFDSATLKLIYHLFNKGVIDKIFGVVNSGKESRIYRGLDPEGKDIAIKIYLTTSKEFRRGMLPYIEGDPRFKLVRRDTHSLIYVWAQKEFKNLQKAYNSGIRVPKPFHVEKNVLVMEFVGEEGVAAPTLKEKPPDKPKEMYIIILKYVKGLYRKAGLVHGDLSEYNIMNLNNEPVIFDVSQAVSIDHPRAEEFLLRDLKNLNQFFQKLDIKTKGVEDLFKWVVKDG